MKKGVARKGFIRGGRRKRCTLLGKRTHNSSEVSDLES